MPWSVRKAGDGRYCVVKKDGGKVVACHETSTKARAQVRALYASEPDAGLDSIELALFVEAARERDVNIPGGSGHQLRDYWTRGPGAAKIRWGTDGSFDRCVRHLGKYVKRPQGLCAEYHKRATGEWPAEKGVPSAGKTLEFELHDGLWELVSDGVIAFATGEKTPKAPYGTGTRYADPGYQADGVKRYPIDTEKHIRAAWSYINVPENAAKYSAADLKKVKGRIKKAMAGIGADVADEREEAALTATQEFHGNHNQDSHGNWADQLGGMKNISKADLDETKKKLSNTAKKPPKATSTRTDADDDLGPTREENARRLAELEDKFEGDEGLSPMERREIRELRRLMSGERDDDDDDSDFGYGERTDFTLTAAGRGKKCPPGKHKMPDETCMDDEEMTDDGDDEMMEYADEPWEGPLVVEGVESGDGRLFALGSLDWAQLPMPLMYQPANTGGHSGSFAVGEINHAVRRGDKIFGRGKIFATALNGEHGDGIRTTMKVGGVSVDVDKVKDADVEMVYDDDGEFGASPFAKPEMTIFHRGRIRGATLVAYPAFVEAKLRFTGTLGDAATETVEAATDVPVKVTKQSCGCNHGEVELDEFSDEDETALVVASAADDSSHTITIPNVPPAHWFSEPTDVEVSGALTITDEGRIYGLVAPAGVTHRNVKTRVPTNLDFSRFHKAETIVRGGGRVVTGVITADCGHAPTENYGTFAKRREHYDNSCSVLANARVGYSRNGNIWVAGALNPGASAEQVAQALGCTLSLDVQPHPDRPGVREFIAAHLVPVPGFPMARSKPSAQYSDGVLSAAALPVAYVDQPRPARVSADRALEFVVRAKSQCARMLGIEPVARKRELALVFGIEE